MALPDPLLHPVAYSTPRRLTHVTAWQEHTPFAMYLVDVLRPTIVVELGTHYGDSYCAFCQAVAELGLPATAFAVDTWEGDEQSGQYGMEVLRDLRAHHDPLYGGFSELLQATFDEARPRFVDGTVDLLHIDGCHRYDAVRHDFESWLPKLSSRGVVLLHDTARQLDDFGVRQLLEELRERYPCLEFTHSSGLAMLLVGDEPEAKLVEATRLEDERLIAFRAFFAALGKGARCVGEAQRAAAEQERLRTQLAEQAAAAEQLQAEMTTAHEAHAAALERRVAELYDSRLLRMGRRLRPGQDGRRAR